MDPGGPAAGGIEAALKRRGARVTWQRERVYRCFAEAGRPLSSAAVAAQLTPERIGIATIYRAIALLAELGLLKRVQEGRTPHYVCAEPGHRHLLVCTGCGAAVQFATCELGLLERLLSQETGYNIEGHRLELFGRCPQCQKLPPEAPE